MKHVPLEVWHEIFIYATRIPGFLSTQGARRFKPLFASRRPVSFPFFDDDSFGDKDEERKPLTVKARESIKMKYTIIQVAKSWNAAARDLLYELVLISSPSQLEQFASAIQRNYRGDTKFGWFVRQFAIQFKRSFASCEVNQVHIADVFQYCPRLEMFSSGKSKDLHLDSIIGSCSESLRFLDYFADSFECLTISIGRLQRLEVLSLVGVAFTAKANATVTPPISLPSLHTLILDVPPRWGCTVENMGQWKLPMLRRVTLTGDGTGSEHFFNAHGSKITTLQLGPTTARHHILSICAPSLEALIIDLKSNFSAIPSMEGLKRLGIADTGNLWARSNLSNISSFFRQFISRERYPVLGEMQLFNYPGTFCFSYWKSWDFPVWKKYEEKMDLLGIRLEDGAGELVKLPSSPRCDCIGNCGGNSDEEEECDDQSDSDYEAEPNADSEELED